MDLDATNHLGRDFKIIVFTGGPCGGKSKYLKKVAEWLRSLGYTVYTMSEIATEIFGGIGLKIDPDNHLPNSLFQPFKIKYQLAKENLLVEAIKSSMAKKKVLLIDRGIMDDLLYAGEELFAEVLASLGLTKMDIRDRRYDAILHLETAAALGNEYYTTENNEERKEDSGLARERDKKTLECWLGHRHLRFIPAFVNKDDKLELIKKHVLQILGDPEPVEIEKKFLVERPDMGLFPVKFEVVGVRQSYLKKDSNGNRPRIRLMWQDESQIFFNTKKEKISNEKSREAESEISKQDYLLRKHDKDKKRRPILKDRHYFFHEKQYFELDFLYEPYSNVTLLEIELLEEGQPVVLPPFIKVIADVTNDPRYKNSNLANMSLG